MKFSKLYLLNAIVIATTTSCIDSKNTTDTNTNTQLNTAPIVANLNNIEATVGQTINLTPLIYDEQGDTLSYVWTINGESFNSETLQYQFSQPGSYDVVLTVYDNQTSTTKNMVVVVSSEAINLSPMITSINDVNVLIDETISISADASDPEGGQLSYSWMYEGQEISNESTLHYASSNSGEFSIILTVKDAQGNQASEEFNITVYAPNQNQKPIIEQITDVEITKGDTFSVTPNVNDPENGQLQYSWTVNGQADQTSAQFSHQFNSTGIFPVELTVTDDAQNTQTMSFNVTVVDAVVNQAPTISQVNNIEITIGETYSVTPVVNDPENGQLQYNWTLSNQTGEQFSYQFDSIGTFTVELTVTDDAQNSATMSFDVKVVNQTVENNWTNVKIGGHGYTPGVIFHPVVPDVYYARTDIGGLYRWDKEIVGWHAVTDSFDVTEGGYIGAESVALDPNNAAMLYMSTGLYVQNGNGRLYISSDQGDSWTHADLPFPVGANNDGRAIGERMMVDPNNPSTLFYGSRTAGLWKSTNSGQNWTQVSSLSTAKMTVNWGDAIPAGIEFVVFDTNTKGTGSATQTIYVGVGPKYASAAGLDKMVYRSTNGGATWEGVSTPLDNDNTDYYIPHVVRSDDGKLYFIFTGGMGPGASGPARLYRYDGNNWDLLRQMNPGSGIDAGYAGLSVYGSGNNTKIALGISGTWGTWAGKPVLELSEDGGANWREISNGKPHTPNEDVSGWIDDVEINPFNPDHIMHVTGGGPWETYNATDANPSWHKMVENLEETATLNLTTPPPSASYALLNASGDIGTWVHTNLTQEPTRTPSGDLKFANGISGDMAWSDPSYIATIGTRHWAFNNTPAARYSRDNGLTWSVFGSMPQGVNPSAGGLDNANNIAVTSPDNIIWSVANSKPYYSTDSGSTWQATGLPVVAPVSNAVGGYHVAADRQNPNKVYAYDYGASWWGTPGNFYYSTDSGKTFSKSTDPNLDLSANDWAHTSIAVNPNAEGDIWLVDGHSVFHSLDSGATWNKLDVTASVYSSNQWPDIYGASAIAVGKAANGSSYSAAVYVVGVINNQWGVYRSDDMGVNWVRINDDNHQYGGIERLAADNKVYGRVYFAGVGRGILYNK
ncbi:PKD domain-containing protein [Marinicellulosiphila megalodicopiae]|uniref:PKD domain-containing protein n=1 Tax=Marinicellulosiphila megalodicopiae TaxID=2724896 RepID=UPI003BB0EC2E